MPGAQDQGKLSCHFNGSKSTYRCQCDGTTPVCSACQTKSKTCTYASDPAVPRVAALKTAHKQLESKYDHLRSLYTRLKEADSADALALLEQIRTTDGIPELPENPSIWQSSSDTANTSGQANPMVSKGKLEERPL